MNPFTESTVALPLSQSPGSAANDPTLNELQAKPKCRGPERPPRSHAADEGRAAARHPHSARPARRRARGRAAANQLAVSWRAYCRKAAGALLGLALALALPSAWAVDVNSADAQQLETISGIGPKTAQVIIDERTRGGGFESFEDLAERVRGIGAKKARSLQEAGLTVGQAAAAPKGKTPPAARKAGK